MHSILTNDQQLTSTYYTSDLHFGHANVIKYCARPYASVEEMNELLISNWNEVVGPEDNCIVIGDISLSTWPITKYTSRLNGYKFLVPGNHDWCHSYHKKGKRNLEKWRRFYEDAGWILLPEQCSFTMDEITFQMCHFPRGHADSTDTYVDKYEKWRPAESEEWLLCGHVHEKWRVRTRTINVGTDVWNYWPVGIGTLLGIARGESNGST